jgi:hypothetical protein
MWVLGSISYTITFIIGFYKWLEPEQPATPQPAGYTFEPDHPPAPEPAAYTPDHQPAPEPAAFTT